jgi:AcrR family transcriptional regulator
LLKSFMGCIYTVTKNFLQLQYVGKVLSVAEPGSSEELLDDELHDELEGEARLTQLVADEFGEEMAQALAEVRRAQERWDRDQHPNEGLRERKKRLTRQRISDTATTMFLTRGFDNVKVSEVAERSAVSEKTVYNYFPTKESLVFDQADEGITRIATTLRERQPSESPTKAIVAALKLDLERYSWISTQLSSVYLPRFSEMVATTPSLQSAWNEIRYRLVDVAREVLAQGADVDPREPEPMVAAHALVALHELSYEALVRHVAAGRRGAELTSAVEAEIDRGARLLDTGLWSFNLLAQGGRTKQQLIEAAKATDEARAQVVEALRQARNAWREVRRQHSQSRP